MTKKISQLSQLTTPHDADLLVVNDSATGVTKKIARSDFFGGLVPPGLVAAYIATSAPTGWLLCDGTAVSRSTYASLYAIIGTTYGAGDGSTTFNLPNMKGKVPVGRDAAQTEFTPLATASGEKVHQLTPNEMPIHNHTVNDPGHSHGVGDPGHSHRIANIGTSGIYGLVDSQHASSSGQNVQTGGSGTGIFIYGSGANISLSNSGGDQSHNNLQPYIVVNYIIKT